jgi:peptidoglycan/LPS O-acetylase OafA/YrhL
VAVLSVLVFHIAGLSVEYQHGCFYGAWTQVLRAGVDVFFVISGVVMTVTTYGKLGKPDTGKRFLIHRVSRIYPPYLFLTVILFLFWMHNPNSVNRHTGGVDLLTSFTLWPAVGQLPLVQVGWTLSFEMMFYLAFFCMIVHVRKENLQHALLFWSLAVVAGTVAIAADSSGTILRMFPRASFFFSPYVLQFVAGCFIGLAYLRTYLVWGRAALIIGALLFVAEAVLCQVIDFQDSNLTGSRTVLRVLLFGIPAVLLVYGLLACGGETGRLPLHRWMVRCGDMSYSIYLVHLPVIHFAYRYGFRLLDHPGLRWLFLAITVAVSLLASVVFHHIVETPFSQWTKESLENAFGVRKRAAAESAPSEHAGVPVPSQAE